MAAWLGAGRRCHRNTDTTPRAYCGESGRRQQVAIPAHPLDSNRMELLCCLGGGQATTNRTSIPTANWMWLSPIWFKIYDKLRHRNDCRRRPVSAPPRVAFWFAIKSNRVSICIIVAAIISIPSCGQFDRRYLYHIYTCSVFLQLQPCQHNSCFTSTTIWFIFTNIVQIHAFGSMSFWPHLSLFFKYMNSLYSLIGIFWSALVLINKCTKRSNSIYAHSMLFLQVRPICVFKVIYKFLK